MAAYDFESPRLFVEVPLAGGADIPCSAEQTNYLVHVLRLTEGAEILVFNGRDGEWRARLSMTGKRSSRLVVTTGVRSQTLGPDIDYLFAPLKRSRLDYMVQKAVEMGVRRLRPVLTRHTVAERVNLARMRANAIEAAEQCGILGVPEISEPETLPRVLEHWHPSRRLVFCDEGSPAGDPVATLARLPPGPMAVLVGPEGGFAAAERELLSGKSFVVPLSLGPRILRADTAAVAALALVNAVCGDWR